MEKNSVCAGHHWRCRNADPSGAATNTSGRSSENLLNPREQRSLRKLGARAL